MNHSRTTFLTRLGLLAAIELMLACTPLGYLRTMGLEISFLMVPVVVGAILLGPLAGAVLGGVFGLTSFASCFGTSAFGAALLSINPAGAFVTCTLARILAGFLCGLLFKLLRKSRLSPSLSTGIAGFFGALLNTVCFMGSLLLFFYNSDFIRQLCQTLGTAGPFAFAASFVGLQGLAEAGVCFVISSECCRTLSAYLGKKAVA